MLFKAPKGMNKAEAKQLLPRVGDKRMEVPTINEDINLGKILAGRRPMPCTVVEVNRAHLWYRVKFENGIVECYKVPKYRPESGGPAR